MRLFTALGPGDIVAAHRAQIAGESVASETSLIFSGQLLEYCREQGIETLALSDNSRLDSLADGFLYLENRPCWLGGRSGLYYHLSKIARALYFTVRAKRFGADLAIVDSGSVHYFALATFWLASIPIVINFHNTLWPNGSRPKRKVARLIQYLDSIFFRYVAAGALGCSPECGRQAQQLAGYSLPYFEYRSQFRASDFRIRETLPDKPDKSVFRIVFAGRIERSKGVFDIISIAERLKESVVPVVFEVCGGGGALPELRRVVEEGGLSKEVRIYGKLERADLLKVYNRAHAVIVPTRSDFCEGLPLVCAEAILSGLPLITSRLSNATTVLGPAVAEAEPEDIESYVRVIRTLVEDGLVHKLLSDACVELGTQFIARSQSYPAAVDRLIGSLCEDWNLLKSFDNMFSRIK